MSYNPGRGFTITSTHGERTISGKKDNHTGSDFGADLGTAVPAAAEGEVWYIKEGHDTYGNVIILRHRGADGNYFYTLYGHLDSIEDFDLNETVDAGRTLGTVGNTGNADGYHLHFEIIDPPWNLTHGKNPEGGIGVEEDTYRIDNDNFTNWPSSGAYDGRQSSSDSHTIQGMSILDWMLQGYPEETIKRAKENAKRDMEEIQRKKRSGSSSSSGETLERRGEKVWRIEDDGSTRGYVKKWSL